MTQETACETVTFGKALDQLKELAKTGNPNNMFMTRPNWYGSEAKPKVFLQVPDENSKMTMPYLYMEKFDLSSTDDEPSIVRFPLDLSCESILADDWVVIN